MIHFASVILAALLPSTFMGNKDACVQAENVPPLVINTKDYTNNIAAIESGKRKMLATDAKVATRYAFGNQLKQLQRKDPKTYGLVGRMEQMRKTSANLKSTDAKWAWMLAMNSCVKQYHQQKGRTNGTVNDVSTSLYRMVSNEEHISNSERSFLYSSFELWEEYKLLHKYYTLIESVKKNVNLPEREKLCAYYYHELRLWRNFSGAYKTISDFIIDSGGGSGVGLFILEEHRIVNRQRSEMLDKELLLIAKRNYKDSYVLEPQEKGGEVSCAECDLEDVTMSDFQEYIKYFKGLKYTYGGWGEQVDAASARKSAPVFEKNIKDWYYVRGCIEKLLPADIQDEYSQLTKKICSYYYCKLKQSKEQVESTIELFSE